MSAETVEEGEIIIALEEFNNCSISTILEDMASFFDNAVNPMRLSRITRIRSALVVLRAAGYARIESSMQPSPMIVPSPRLLKLLGSERLTTDVEPLIMPAVRHSLSRDEASVCASYLEAFTEALKNEMPMYIYSHAPLVNMWEIGIVRQRRGPRGKLEWSLSREARQAGSCENALKGLS